MGGQKAQPQQVGNFGKVSEQLRQVITAFQVLTKAVNDLPEQNELLSAAGDEAAGFLENFFRVAAAFFSAFARNDALSAGVRAAKHDWKVLRDGMRLQRGEPEGAVQDVIDPFAPGFRVRVLDPPFERAQEGFGV